MKNEKSKILKKYILLKIWCEEWKKGEKIKSAQELSIKFSLSISIVKKILSSFVVSNILITKPKKGFFVNQEIFDYLPLSLREKYNAKLIKIKLYKLKTQNKLIKEYWFNENKKCAWVESSFSKKIVFNKDLLREKTFMWNLAWHGIVISKISSKKFLKTIDNQSFVIEKRKLYDMDKKNIISETIYVSANQWFENSEFNI